MPVNLRALDKISDGSLDEAIAAVNILTEAIAAGNTALGTNASALAIVRKALVARKATLADKSV